MITREDVVKMIERVRGCNHSPDKITYYQGFTYIDPVTKDMMQVDGVWVCECGASFEHDPVTQEVIEEPDPFDIDFENL